jgi:ABC-type molybdate transport system substrate-binding protein
MSTDQRRRGFIQASAALAAAPLPAPRAAGVVPQAPGTPPEAVVWKPMLAPPPNVPVLNGFTDTVPDIVGRLGARIDLALFSEGNQFPALLGPDVIEPFRRWAKSRPQYATLTLDNIVIVTLPQPIIVSAIEGNGITLGNLSLAVNRVCGFYPDIVMGGAMPLKTLRQAGLIEGRARVFARNRGLALLVAAGNPLGIAHLDDLAQPSVRVVMASASEAGARGQYIAALEALAGREKTASILARESVTFPGRLGIQHRDVLQAIATGHADVGIIFRHLAHYFATAYPDLCAMLTVPGAERFASSLAMTTASPPLRTQATGAFSEFFFGIAREVYPRYEFALLSESEFGAAIVLD